MFRSPTAPELQRGAALDLGGWARVWGSATSLVARVLDGLVRFSEPYYADAAATGAFLERMPPERRVEAALEWQSRNQRIV